MAAAIIKRLENRRGMLENDLSILEGALKTATSEDLARVCTLQQILTMVAGGVDAMREVCQELETHEVDRQDALLQYRTRYVLLTGSAKAIIKEAEGKTVQPQEPKARARMLPHMALPAFSGNCGEWPGFRDMFRRIIDEETALSKVEKMVYLRGCLSGQPLSMVQSVPLSEDGYEIAWNVLVEHYENVNTLIQTHVESLLELPDVRRDDVTSLQELINVATTNLAALKALKRPTDSWDDLLIRIVVRRLDSKMKDDWEAVVHKEPQAAVPTWSGLLQFMRARSRQLQATRGSTMGKTLGERRIAKPVLVVTTPRACAICGSEHLEERCVQLAAMSVDQRRATIREKNLCFNCLRSGHMVGRCRKPAACGACSKKHHNLLHKEPEVETEPAYVPSVAHAASLAAQVSTALLSTCLVNLRDPSGQEHAVRAILDSGSAVNIISANCARRVGLRGQSKGVPLMVAGGGQTHTAMMVTTTLKSRTSNFELTMNAHILPQITGNVPTTRLAHVPSAVPPNIKLADPRFHQPGPVELLIGNGVLPKLHLDGRIDMGNIVFANTKLGWIVQGEWPGDVIEDAKLVTEPSLHLNLREPVTRFWNVEAHAPPAVMPADKMEAHFESTSVRAADSHFIVALPFKEPPGSLGDSRAQARHAFLSLERRLMKNSAVYTRYCEFMRDYEALGHMRVVTGNLQSGYYLPHHCIMKEASLTTKLRVVFNASAPSASGKSLNDVLRVGPQQQDDLFAIILRFRCWQCVYMATTQNGEDSTANLICAKSQVAPIKQLSIPRLELAAALLLVELMDYVKSALRLSNVQCRYYSDSRMVLTWIAADSHQLKTFVANRVGQRLTQQCEWAHIPGESNPTDLISRGASAKQLKESELWWHGPDVASRKKPSSTFCPVAPIPEERCLIVQAWECIWPPGSSFSKAKQVCAYVLRFIKAARQRQRVPAIGLKGWQLVQKLRQDLWKRWHKEYLVELHQRSKWKVPTPSLAKDQLVVVREANQSPLAWNLDAS